MDIKKEAVNFFLDSMTVQGKYIAELKEKGIKPLEILAIIEKAKKLYKKTDKNLKNLTKF